MEDEFMSEYVRNVGRRMGEQLRTMIREAGLSDKEGQNLIDNVVSRIRINGEPILTHSNYPNGGITT